MNAHFPDTETIRTVLTLATRAPSVYNTQPWRWRVSDEALHLHGDPCLQLHNTDPDGRDLILSCGATLHHCVIALAGLGWRCKVHWLPDPGDNDHLATIKVYPGNVDEVDVALAAAIPRRRTDRRYYSSWPVPAGDIALMGARAARLGVMLREVDALDNLKAIVTQAVRSHVTDQDYLTELTVWSGRYDSKAGVPARNTPAHDCAAPIPGRVCAGPGLAQPTGASAADDKAVILALGTQTDDRLARLRAGEATSVVLLTATALGLASCAQTCSAPAAFRRCWCGWAGHRLTPIRCRPHRDADLNASSNGGQQVSEMSLRSKRLGIVVGVDGSPVESRCGLGRT